MNKYADADKKLPDALMDAVTHDLAPGVRRNAERNVCIL